jgi:hypothetical protein
MKELSILSASVLVLGLGGAPLTFADDTPNTCSVATLRGTYAFSGVGTDSGVPYTTSGRETYDGAGHIKYYQLWEEGGATYTYTGTGTYTMSADCVATAIYGGNTARRWTFFTGPEGSVIYYNNNTTGNSGIESAGHEDRVSRTLLF